MKSIQHTAHIRRPSAHGVRAALIARGTSVHAWAKSHRYRLSSVYTVIERWIDNPDRRGRLPLGGISRQIAHDLQAELGPDVVPLPELER
jgi:hypothetical protein